MIGSSYVLFDSNLTIKKKTVIHSALLLKRFYLDMPVLIRLVPGLAAGWFTNVISKSTLSRGLEYKRLH